MKYRTRILASISVIEIFFLLFSCNSSISDKAVKIETDFQDSIKRVAIQIDSSKIDDRIQALVEKNGIKQVITSIISLSNKGESSIIDLGQHLSNNDLEWDILESKVSSYSPTETRSTLMAASDYVKSLSQAEADKYIERISSWCAGLEQYKELEQESFYSLEALMEVLYHIDITKVLFENKTQISSQGVGSLSSYQMKEIYFESLNLISNLTDEERTVFFSDLHKDISRL